MLSGFSIAYYTIPQPTAYFISSMIGSARLRNTPRLSNLEGVSSELVISLETFIHDQISLIIIG